MVTAEGLDVFNLECLDVEVVLGWQSVYLV
jgi:hypothetical protein